MVGILAIRRKCAWIRTKLLRTVPHDNQRFLGLGHLFNDALGLLDDAPVLALFLFGMNAGGYQLRPPRARHGLESRQNEVRQISVIIAGAQSIEYALAVRVNDAVPVVCDGRAQVAPDADAVARRPVRHRLRPRSIETTSPPSPLPLMTAPARSVAARKGSSNK